MTAISAHHSSTLADKMIEKTVESFFSNIASKLPATIKNTYDNGKLILNKGLPSYLRAQYSKCETIRTLLRRDAPVLLKNIYVEPKFSIDEKELGSSELLAINSANQNPIIVTGLAGSGKSVFLKWSFQKSIELGHTYYPIFFEVRTLSRTKAATVLDAIYESIAIYAEDFTRDQFKFGLKKGLFYLMIDAIDEAPATFSESLPIELDEIARKFPKCPLIVTSRPSIGIKNWEAFTEAHLLPFDENRCREYINKIEFDTSRKSEFISKFNGNFFNKYEEFLSNALLASMMLLTFDEFGEIPEKRHVFYQKCFEVLLREHDHSKGSFRRELISGLEHSEIERLFQTFCVFTYLDEKYILTDFEFERYICDAMEYCDIIAETEDVKLDFCRSVSLMQADGQYLEFVHRSFQEYFYAKFFANDRTQSVRDKALEIAGKFDSRNLLDMIAEMDRDYFNFELVLPELIRLVKKFEDVDPTKKPDLILKNFCDEVGFENVPTDVDDSATEIETNHLSSQKSTVAAHKRSDLSFVIVHYQKSGDEQIHLNSYILFYIQRFQGKNSTNIPWPMSMTKDKVRAKLRAFPKLLDKLEVANQVAIKLHHYERSALVALGLGTFASAIKVSFRDTADSLLAAQQRKSKSLASRMRSRPK